MHNKYHISSKESRTYDGIVFDSRLELQYYRDVLVPAMACGDVTDVKRQVAYTLQPSFKRAGKAVRAITYKADFVVTYKDGTIQVIDIKGMATPEAKLKRKLFWFVYPDTNYIWLGYSKKTGWINWDELH